MLLTPWSYPKCRNILHTLNVYEIAAKEHQVVDLWASDEISVLERLFLKYLEYVALILRNYKKIKRTNIFIFTNSSILSAEYILVTTVE